MQLTALTHTLRAHHHISRGLLALSLAMTASYAQPQSTATSQTAIISGTVTDSSGAVVPKASVSLEVAGSSTLQTTTDSTGHFAIEATPGEYILKIFAQGFKVFMKTGHPTAATPALENIQLSIANGGCGVCVAPGAPPFEPLNASLTATLPLKPLPPYRTSVKNLKHLQR